jgi:hypothetical protein
MDLRKQVAVFIIKAKGDWRKPASTLSGCRDRLGRNDWQK